MFSSSSINSVELIVNTERNTICITIITTHSTREHNSNLSRLLYRLEYNCIPNHMLHFILSFYCFYIELSIQTIPSVFILLFVYLFSLGKNYEDIINEFGSKIARKVLV